MRGVRKSPPFPPFVACASFLGPVFRAVSPLAGGQRAALGPGGGCAGWEEVQAPVIGEQQLHIQSVICHHIGREQLHYFSLWDRSLLAEHAASPCLSSRLCGRLVKKEPGWYFIGHAHWKWHCAHSCIGWADRYPLPVMMLGLRTPSCPLAVFFLLCLIGWSQCCPVLIHSCKCVVERSKPGVGSSTAPRKKVICTNEDLLEVPDPALLPNKTGTL